MREPGISLMAVGAVFCAVALVLLIAWNTGPFYYHFGDTRLVNLYSFFQLFATSLVAYSVSRARERETGRSWRNNPAARPFFISACGFLYLGLDDLLSIHENIDKLIHVILRFKETPFSDHIDDMILVLYGLVAIFFIRDFIREFRRYRPMMTLCILGLISFFVMCCMDVVSNNVETYRWFFPGTAPDAVVHSKDVLNMVDESFQLIGESFFLSAFLVALLRPPKWGGGGTDA